MEGEAHEEARLEKKLTISYYKRINEVL